MKLSIKNSSITRSIYLSTVSVCLSVYLFIYLSIYLFIYLSIYLSMYLSIYLSIYLQYLSTVSFRISIVLLYLIILFACELLSFSVCMKTQNYLQDLILEEVGCVDQNKIYPNPLCFCLTVWTTEELGMIPFPSTQPSPIHIWPNPALDLGGY